MTQNGNLKRRVRARAAKTGESYTAALQHVRKPPIEPAIHSLRIAVAQTSIFNDPRDACALRASGTELRALMLEAQKLGARLIHFPEGAMCSPNKRIMSERGPRDIGPSDWNLCDWNTLHQELEATRKLARKLKLWTVLGSVHQLTPPHRPHNSLYVISDNGKLAARYDERLLSHTKSSYMYSPGQHPVTFQVGGIRFGCSMGMEVHYPEIFSEYERHDVDCVLFSTTGETPSAAFAAEALGHAAMNGYWVSFAAHAPNSVIAPSGIAGTDGQWATQCPPTGKTAIAVTTITAHPASLARDWRRKVRLDFKNLTNERF